MVSIHHINERSSTHKQTSLFQELEELINSKNKKKITIMVIFIIIFILIATTLLTFFHAKKNWEFLENTKNIYFMTNKIFSLAHS